MTRQLLHRYWLALWGAVAVGLTVFSLAATVSASSSYNAAQQLAGKQAHFYGVVAGQPPSDSPTVADQLALDLRTKLGKVDPQAHRLPAAIESFRGDPNVYGGVTDALGVDPFTSSDCAECGQLTSSVKTRLLEVKQGRLDQLLAAERPHKPVFNPAWYAALLWLLAGPALWLRSRIRREKTLRKHYPQEMHLIDQLCETLHATPNDEKHAAQRAELEKLLEQLRSITQGSESAETQDVIEQAKLQLKARREAEAEVKELTY